MAAVGHNVSCMREREKRMDDTLLVIRRCWSISNRQDEHGGGTSLDLTCLIGIMPSKLLLDPCPDPARVPRKLQVVLLLHPCAPCA